MSPGGENNKINMHISSWNFFIPFDSLSRSLVCSVYLALFFPLLESECFLNSSLQLVSSSELLCFAVLCGVQISVHYSNYCI